MDMRIGTEIRWTLSGRGPDRFPMSRLAEYMKELAAMFGEDENVHFVRLEDGSTSVVAKIDAGVPSQRVQSRVIAIRDGRASETAMRAFRRVDDMVGEDGGPARLIYGASVVLRFPGRQIVRDRIFSITERGAVTGRLYALIEESTGQLRARIRPSGDNYVPCTADPSVGRDMRNFFMDAVRAYGLGTWARTLGGEWTCRSLHVETVQPVKDVSLREAINSLRATEADWPSDPLADWADLEEVGAA
jgi:hypothetical protein